MGSCLSKEEEEADVGHLENCIVLSAMPDSSESTPKRKKMDSAHVDRLINEILKFISNYEEGEEVLPQLTELNNLAETEQGWLEVIGALVRTVPLENPLGASTIAIVFDDCPLPAKDTVLEFTESLRLSRGRAIASYDTEESRRQERNVLVVVGCIAHKFGGPQGGHRLTDDVLGYLITFLVKEEDPRLVIFALVALEKFAISRENKDIITNYMASMTLHPLLHLELYYGSSDYMWREVGFFARWALDNSFVFEGRRNSYECVDMSTINALLNTNDTSEYLKISSDGLEARCDSHSFESVRATFRIDRGVWFYEVELITDGIMQIGWASLDSKFHNHEGYGVGDDTFSVAYDGCRGLIWHRATAKTEVCSEKWHRGDFIGCLIDIDQQDAIFYHNGTKLPTFHDIFKHTRTTLDTETGNCSEGFYPAASFMAHQQCRFNFGATPFQYPPINRTYNIINEHGYLTAEEKKIIPRRLIIERIQEEDRRDGQTCSVCYNEEGNFGLLPCEHEGFCHTCAKKLKVCPLCRQEVLDIYIMLL